MTAGSTSVAEAVAYLRARGEDEAVGTVDTRWAYKRSADYIESALSPQPVVDREALATREQIDRLADLWHVPAEVRVAGAELEQEILAAPKVVAAEQLVSDTIRDSLAFENDMPRGHLLVQIANRASHLLFQQGVIAPESSRPTPTADEIAGVLFDYTYGLPSANAAADAVLALLNARQS